MSSRYYPISESFFDSEMKPIILSHQIWKCRPPKISDYQAFCAIFTFCVPACRGVIPRLFLVIGMQYINGSIAAMRRVCGGKYFWFCSVRKNARLILH